MVFGTVTWNKWGYIIRDIYNFKSYWAQRVLNKNFSDCLSLDYLPFSLWTIRQASASVVCNYHLIKLEGITPPTMYQLKKFFFFFREMKMKWNSQIQIPFLFLIMIKFWRNTSFSCKCSTKANRYRFFMRLIQWLKTIFVKISDYPFPSIGKIYIFLP